jgi:hypothetical protein
MTTSEAKEEPEPPCPCNNVVLLISDFAIRYPAGAGLGVELAIRTGSWVDVLCRSATGVYRSRNEQLLSSWEVSDRCRQALADDRHAHQEIALCELYTCSEGVVRTGI